MDKIKQGDYVKIIKVTSHFYNCIGEAFKKGNGDNWEIVLDYGIGVYFSEKDLQKI